MTGKPHALEISRLTVEYPRGRGRPPLRAVDGVTFSLPAGQTIGVVGESGSGKSTIGRAILGLTPITAGRVLLAGEDITHASQRRRRDLSSQLQVIFQDPYSSLNPTRTIGQTLSETLRVHEDLSSRQLRDRVGDMLERVGLTADAAARYPLHFSGGQRQRIAIARALIAQPRTVICDEPTSALDLSVQAQVLNLLRALQSDFNLSFLFISHDLAVVRHLSHRVIVLYRGRVMEEGQTSDLFSHKRHPYTRALLEAAPSPDPEEHRVQSVQRLRPEAASSTDVGTGCPFASRCPHVIDACRRSRPDLEPTPGGGSIACIRWKDLAHGHDAVLRGTSLSGTLRQA